MCLMKIMSIVKSVVKWENEYKFYKQRNLLLIIIFLVFRVLEK
jgi:hypothetical protein